MNLARLVLGIAAPLAILAASTPTPAGADADSRLHLPDLRLERPATIVRIERGTRGALFTPAVTVVNGGLARAGSFTVTAFLHFRDANGTETRRSFSATVPGLERGASREVTFLDRSTRFPLAPNGSGYVVYSADPPAGAEFGDTRGRIVEISESNNAVRADFTTPRR